MLKAVLFDMDDTLLDWSKKSVEWPDHERQHLQLVYDYINRDVHPLMAAPDTFFESVRNFSRQGWAESAIALRAPSYPEAMRMGLLELGVPPERIDLDACLRVMEWKLIGGVTIFPEVPEVLDLLASRGVRIGLVTNASLPMKMRDRELEMLGILQYFADCRIAAVDVGYLKPHPEIFLSALTRLGLNADEVVFVGDNAEADIKGAQSVGMRAVLRQIRPELPPALVNGEIEPDGVVTSLHELLPLLDIWYPAWRGE
jgi:HAD superfamily hydrolase (TIGR01662 family)